VAYRHDDQRDVPSKQDGEREVQGNMPPGIEQKGEEPDKSERKPEAGPKHRPKNALSAGGSTRLSLERVMTRHRLLLLLHEIAPSSRLKNVFTHAHRFYVPLPHGVREIRVLVAQSVGQRHPRMLKGTFGSRLRFALHFKAPGGCYHTTSRRVNPRCLSTGLCESVCWGASRRFGSRWQSVSNAICPCLRARKAPTQK
jgi:hypothetical protein